jgi:NAD(P)-dependent dehydrogenase (short-subunit alcohol dehydrogenase family)
MIIPDAQRAARLAGAIAIVTGASRGIGRAIALRLAREGGTLVLAARDQRTLTGVADEIAAGGGVATSVAGDLRVPEAPAAVVRAALDAYGSNGCSNGHSNGAFGASPVIRTPEPVIGGRPIGNFVAAVEPARRLPPPWSCVHDERSWPSV